MKSYEDIVAKLGLVDKINNGEDYSKEIQVIKESDRETQIEVSEILIAKAYEDENENPSKWTAALEQIGFVDPVYASDLGRMLELSNEDYQANSQKYAFVVEILKRPPYTTTIDEVRFWQYLSNMAIYAGADNYLEALVVKIEGVMNDVEYDY